MPLISTIFFSSSAGRRKKSGRKQVEMSLYGANGPVGPQGPYGPVPLPNGYPQWAPPGSPQTDPLLGAGGSPSALLNRRAAPSMGPQSGAERPVTSRRKKQNP